MNRTAVDRVLIAITGASGSCYAISLLERLQGRRERWVVLSATAAEVVLLETGLREDALRKHAEQYFAVDDLAAQPASGSARLDAMVVIPCSLNTLAKIAHGIADNLITRAAAVMLKERRKLIMVPRETPLSTIALENMLTLSRSGVVILPAAPGFYHRPRTIEELVDFVVERVLDHLDVEVDGKRWEGRESMDVPD